MFETMSNGHIIYPRALVALHRVAHPSWTPIQHARHILGLTATRITWIDVSILQIDCQRICLDIEVARAELDYIRSQLS